MKAWTSSSLPNKTQSYYSLLKILLTVSYLNLTIHLVSYYTFLIKDFFLAIKKFKNDEQSINFVLTLALL
jgi:hypothetical protein